MPDPPVHPEQRVVGGNWRPCSRREPRRTERWEGGAGLTSERVLNPRIYRTGLIAVAMAGVVFAFSLGHEQGPLTTTLVPDAFNPSGQGNPANATMDSLASMY